MEIESSHPIADFLASTVAKLDEEKASRLLQMLVEENTVKKSQLPEEICALLDEQEKGKEEIESEARLYTLKKRKTKSSLDEDSDSSISSVPKTLKNGEDSNLATLKIAEQDEDADEPFSQLQHVDKELLFNIGDKKNNVPLQKLVDEQFNNFCEFLRSAEVEGMSYENYLLLYHDIDEFTRLEPGKQKDRKARRIYETYIMKKANSKGSPKTPYFLYFDFFFLSVNSNSFILYV